jgi:exosortase A-associated hydrolase 1
MSAAEIPFAFPCGTEMLLGLLHRPAEPARRGVLIVVGGPQYRVGSHRQFLLLARALAHAGIPTMRFDYRGMGDSDGDYAGFEGIDADIAAAIDAFTTRCPEMKEIVIWALCDGASAALFYAYRDARVSGLVLVNPWVRTVAGEAKAYLRHYYLSRLLERGFWRKIVAGQFSVTASLRSLFELLRKARARDGGASTARARESLGGRRDLALPQRMAEGMRRFDGSVLLILSSNDLTAREFEDAAAASPLWRGLLAAPRVERKSLRGADHTFSRREWRQQVCDWTIAWVNESGRAASKA